MYVHVKVKKEYLPALISSSYCDFLFPPLGASCPGLRPDPDLLDPPDPDLLDPLDPGRLDPPDPGLLEPPDAGLLDPDFLGAPDDDLGWDGFLLFWEGLGVTLFGFGF